MPNMPAFCSSCGLVFGSGIVIENSTGINLRGVSSVCPRCGASARVPDGIYDVLGDVVRLLSGPESSRSQLANLQRVLKRAQDTKQAPEDVRKAIADTAPELSTLASVLPATRVELYAFITVLLTLLGLLVAGYSAVKPNGPTQQEIDQMVQRALDSASTPSATNQPTKRKAAKVGRNATCPCGSGKKYKKCCIGAEG